MKINIPDEILRKPDYGEPELMNFKVDVAVVLYQRKALTLARATRWVDMTRLQFQKALAERNVPINYDIEDFQIDLTTIKSMPN